MIYYTRNSNDEIAYGGGERIYRAETLEGGDRRTEGVPYWPRLGGNVLAVKRLGLRASELILNEQTGYFRHRQ